MRWSSCVTFFMGAMVCLSARAVAQPAKSPPLPAGPPHDVCKATLAREEAGDYTTSSRGPCHKAYLFGGATEDMRLEVASLMSPARIPTLDDVAVGSLLADAAIRRATDEPWGYLARCDIARRLGNAEALQMCLAELQRVAPAHPVTKWMLAAAKERTPMTIWILASVSLGHPDCNCGPRAPRDVAGATPGAFDRRRAAGRVDDHARGRLGCPGNAHGEQGPPQQLRGR